RRHPGADGVSGRRLVRSDSRHSCARASARPSEGPRGDSTAPDAGRHVRGGHSVRRRPRLSRRAPPLRSTALREDVRHVVRTDHSERTRQPGLGNSGGDFPRLRGRAPRVLAVPRSGDSAEPRDRPGLHSPAPVMQDVELSVVAPLFEEEAVIRAFVDRVRAALATVTSAFEIIFSIDPSRADATEDVARELAAADPRIRLLIMSRRFGQPAATIAGIEACSGRACLVLDADLQDPPEIIPSMVEQWRAGYDVVCAQRRRRDGERWTKRLVAHTGYWLINRISDVPIPRDTGDCRLIDRKVIDVLRMLPER